MGLSEEVCTVSVLTNERVKIDDSQPITDLKTDLVDISILLVSAILDAVSLLYI